MSSAFQKFKHLHQSKGLFILPNAWDAKSAFILQEKQFSAIATSSAAVANSLGYDDGEKMPFDDYLFVIKRIISSVKIPLSVDMEMGYGSSNEEIYNNILKLIDLGVAGINIEDSFINKQGRFLKEAKSFANTIEFIKNKLESNNLHLFINIRCDTYILNVENKEQETRQRIKNYETTGADGLFLPCIYREEDIAEAVSSTHLSVNVMCVPNLPGFDVLNKLGINRVSMGPFLMNKVYNNINHLSGEIITDNNFSSLLS